MSLGGVPVDVEGMVDVFRRFHFLRSSRSLNPFIVASLVACLSRLASYLGRCGRMVVTIM